MLKKVVILASPALSPAASPAESRAYKYARAIMLALELFYDCKIFGPTLDIMGNQSSDGPITGDIFLFFEDNQEQENKIQTSLLQTNPQARFVSRKELVLTNFSASIMTSLANLIGLNPIVPEATMIPIPIQTLLCIPDGPVDLYIKIGSGPDPKFIKRYSYMLPGTYGEVTQYFKKGLQEFYITADQINKLYDYVEQKILSQLNLSDAYDNLSKTTLLDGSMSYISSSLAQLRLSENVMKTAEKLIENMEGWESKHNTLEDMIQELLKDKASYRFTHSVLLMRTCFHINKQINSNADFQKPTLVFSTLLHDILLPHDHLAKIHSAKEVDLFCKDNHERSLVQKHAKLIGELSHLFPGCPSVCSQILTQHHGSLSGIDFSEDLSTKLHPTAMMLMVAEEYIRIRLDNRKLKNAEMLMILKTKMSKNSQKHFIECLKDFP
ncbi:MAG: hypothetical protein AABY86_10940 [Bdellovibrionota bacterium]